MKLETIATLSESPLEETLVQSITLALRGTGYFELLQIDVSVDGNDVLLQGRVPNYFLKQKAEHLTRSIPDVGSLTSDIEVIRL